MSRCIRGLVRGTCFGLLFVSVGAAALAQEGSEVRFEGRGELWLDAGELHVEELKP